MKLIEKDDFSYQLFFEQEAHSAASYILDPTKNYEWSDLPYAVLLISETSRHFRCSCTPYTVFNNFLRILWLFLENVKSEVKESSKYLLRLDTGSFEDILHFINDLDNSGYIFIAKDHHCFDYEEYDYKNQISIVDDSRDILTSSSLYKGHEKSLSKLLEEDKESREKHNYPKLLKFTPRELIKEVIDCYDENISEIPVNSFTYRSSLFQNLRNYISFFRELGKHLTDDWKKDREYLGGYDFTTKEVTQPIPVSETELDELKNKYTKANPLGFYYNLESYRNGQKKGDLLALEGSLFTFEDDNAEYLMKVKCSKAGRYRLLRVSSDTAIFDVVTDFILYEKKNELIVLNNEYGIPINFSNYYIAEVTMPDWFIQSQVYPENSNIKLATFELVRLGD
jgi:hypothetical protein